MSDSAELNKECFAEVKAFLANHEAPCIRVATTMIDGYATCIKPIKTICGAEIMCSPATRDAVVRLIEQETIYPRSAQSPPPPQRSETDRAG